MYDVCVKGERRWSSWLLGDDVTDAICIWDADLWDQDGIGPGSDGWSGDQPTL